jgi:hypothetical protein
MNIEFYKTLYIGRDLVSQEKISKAFSSNYSMQSVRSTAAAAELLQTFRYDVVIFDENILISENLEGIESTSIKLIYKISIVKNIKAVFIYVYEKNSTFIKTFQKLSEGTIFFKKDNFNSSRLAFSLSLLSRSRYRSILTREIVIGKSYPMPLYFIDKEEKNNKVFLEANKPIENNILALLKAKKMMHLYVKAEDLTPYLEEANLALPSSKIFTLKLNNIRKRTKKLFAYLSDDSTSPDFQQGGIDHKLAQEICTDLDKLINNFPDLTCAIEELPYPRISLLNHCINCTIYILIFSRICYVENREQVAVGALLHDVGLARTDFNLPESYEEKMSIAHPQNIPAVEHALASTEILRDKKLTISNTTRDTILTHHELADGTGGPSGKNQVQLKDFEMLLPIADYLDELRTINAGDIENTFTATFKKMHEADLATNQFGKLGPFFSSTLMKQISSYFNIG